MKGYTPPASARSDGKQWEKQEGGEFHLSEPVNTKGGNNFPLGGKSNTLDIQLGERKAERLFDTLLSHAFLGGKGCSSLEFFKSSLPFLVTRSWFSIMVLLS